MDTKFLFMDELYGPSGSGTFSSDAPVVSPNKSRKKRYVALTGVLMAAHMHSIFREQFYKLVADILQLASNKVLHPFPVIHASSLFPDRTDDERIAFFEGIATLVVDLALPIYRVGYCNQEAIEVGMKEKDLLSMCFFGMLSCLEKELEANQIWPIMEFDRNTNGQDKGQDRAFGIIQQIDYFSSIIDSRSVSIDNRNIGEIFYSTKRSACGAVTDCISYLLDAQFIKMSGYSLSPFKNRIADIASKFRPLVVFDEIIELQTSVPPRGYKSSGPPRYVYKIEPRD